MRKLDLTGKRFGRLVAMGKATKDKQGKTRWMCRCDCGKSTIVRTYCLNREDTQSCGCLSIEKRTKHGMNGTRPHRIWQLMRSRCSLPGASGYKYYGGRGIKVCDSWDNSFLSFWNDMKEEYDDSLTIDRIDNNGNYEKSNCRWVSYQVQVHNSRMRSTNKTGTEGVCKEKSGKYLVQITLNKIRHKLGRFKTIDEAIKVIKIAEPWVKANIK